MGLGGYTEDVSAEILQLSKAISNSQKNNEISKRAININSKLLKNQQAITFDVIKKQYGNTQALYEKGVINRVIYEKFNKFFRVKELEQEISDYLNYVVSNIIDEQDAFIILDGLQKACQNRLILDISSDCLSKINCLLNNINSNISKSSSLKQTTLAYKIKELSGKYLSPSVAQNSFLLEQNITINIKPIDSNFAVKDIDFTATENKKLFKENALVLNNNHIVDLDIDEKIYGVDGYVDFELAYPDNHPDFKFLLDTKQPLFLDIKIADKYNFLKKGSKTENHTREYKFLAIGNIENSANVQKKSLNNIFSIKTDDNNNDNYLKRFKITFSDPLKVLWSLHKPTYIDFKKSVDDIFQENFYFGNIVKLDTEKSKNIKKRFHQIFLSTSERSFYDFFIEQLSLNGCVLKFHCDKDIATYFVADKIDNSFKQNFANTQDDIQQKFHDYDLSAMQEQVVVLNSCDIHTKRTQVIPDISFKKSKKNDIDDKDGSQEFENIYQTILYPTDYLQVGKPQQEKPFQESYAVTVNSINGLAFVNSEIDLSKIDNQGYLLGSKDLSSIYLSKRKIKLKRSERCSQELYRNIFNQYYKKNTDTEMYEKISFCPKQYLTHANYFEYLYKDFNNQEPEYPSFKRYKEFDVVGKVTIGKNVSEDSKKAYKFFKNYKMEESSFADVQEEDEKGSNKIANSKKELFYALEVPNEILYPKTSEDPIIYIPTRININSNLNEFMPLRNDDVVVVKATSLTESHGHKIVSNSAISTEKAQKQLLQRHLLGAKENCEVAYTQEDDDETYSIKQLNKENDNSIFINNKKGIFLTYKAKGS
ncbi:hypothetical protein LO80_06270 [Candidatus Francisella endociliophora]|uniref:Pathogenicity determinant protein PdpA1 n=2 Tax=Candidatus Francisella endociliophora TaxID=653937 RepID=A0A097EPW0_9GAMM|nr:hypothetical protein LO80_06270 [Francisella sp. FSC1006]